MRNVITPLGTTPRVLLLALLLASPLHAQNPAPSGPGAGGPILASAIGGVVGGIVVGGGLGMLAGGGWDGAAMAVLTAPLGYAMGGAIGAAKAASDSVASVSTGSMIGPSLLGAGVGLGLFALIGDGFDSEDHSGESDYTSWNVGAALGILAHAVITGTIARDKARGAYERRAEGLTVSPLVRDGGYGVRFELIH